MKNEFWKIVLTIVSYPFLFAMSLVFGLGFAILAFMATVIELPFQFIECVIADDSPADGDILDR